MPFAMDVCVGVCMGVVICKETCTYVHKKKSTSTYQSLYNKQGCNKILKTDAC